MLAARVLEKLAVEEEIFVELLVPAQLSPMDWAPLEESVRVTGSLLTVEEGTGGWSWGTEIAAVMSERLFGRLRRPSRSSQASAPSSPRRGSARRDARRRADRSKPRSWRRRR